MAKTKADLDAELQALKETVRKLAAHTEVVAVALRTPDAVNPAELDDAIAAIHRLYEDLLP